MTPDERVEKLLNRAGQTISDLPRSFAGGPEAYGEEARKNALCAAWSWYLPAVISAGDAVDFMQNRRNETVMAQYILHLTDVIDRMETALENVCGERDYLLKTVSLQEPRVLTLDEIVNLIGVPRWAEYKVAIPGTNDVMVQAGWVMVIDEQLINREYDEHFVTFADEFGTHKYHVGAYKKGWRCWSSRPTEEQSEAAPWNT